jgi:hypothetical protein
VCEAVCTRNPDHAEPPVDGCSCGIYCTHSLHSLFAQYGEFAARIVCVIAPEGPTLTGDTGMRTNAADRGLLVRPSRLAHRAVRAGGLQARRSWCAPVLQPQADGPAVRTRGETQTLTATLTPRSSIYIFSATARSTSRASWASAPPQ